MPRKPKSNRSRPFINDINKQKQAEKQSKTKKQPKKVLFKDHPVYITESETDSEFEISLILIKDDHDLIEEKDIKSK
jgi:hypothetical protein